MPLVTPAGSPPASKRRLGIPSYSEFTHAFEEYVSKNDPSQLSLAVIDIKNFRGYRHRYGYDASNELLRLVAKTLRDIVDKGVVGHLAHDKFLVCAPSGLIDGYIGALRDKIMAFRSEIEFEVKAGIAELLDTQDISELKGRATLACDAAKRSSGIPYRLYDEHLRREVEMRAHALKALDKAIANGDIQVYIQPHVRVQTGAVCGAEALVRWLDPDFGMLFPGDFIPVLEEHGLIHKVDLHVIDRVAAAIRRYMESGEPFVPISVNLSRQDFTACDIVTEVESIINRNRIPRELIELEVTETVLHADPGIFRESIAAFRRLGYQVWMDDFGAGYSSLNVLKDYEFDLLKIDMNFMRTLDAQANSRVIVSSIIDMAKQLGIRTLAEGVETVEHMDFLRSVGCEKAQGYLFSRPEPPEVIARMVKEGKLVLEDLESADYYDKSGRVNLLSPQPLGGSKAHAKVEGSLPLAIVETSRERTVFLQCNRAFEAFVRTLGFASTAAIEKIFSQTYGGAPHAFLDAFMAAKTSGTEQHLNYVTNGHTCLVRVAYIATCDSREVDSYLVSAIEQRGTTNEVYASLMDVSKSSVFNLFSRVDILSEANDLIENLHITGTRYLGEHETGDVIRSVDTFAQNNIHPDDWKRFRELYDVRELNGKILSTGKGYVTESFRTRTAVGGYEWQAFTIMPVIHKGRRYFLSCVRDADEAPSDLLPHARGIIPERLLWQALLNVESIGIFWKDQQRRFIGANQHFIDYYGFDSAADFVGKTDEEMGWHIDPVPFKSDEERVSEQGETVNDEIGRCIARGTVRTIAATKTPVIEDGELLGFVGFFREVSREEEDAEFRAPRSLDEVYETYREAFEKRGIDFMSLSAKLENAHDYERRYDEDYVQRLMQVLVRNVEKVEMSRGVVAQSGKYRITILQQPQSASEIDAFVRACSSVLNDLTVVDGVPCRPRMSVRLTVASRDGVGHASPAD